MIHGSYELGNKEDFNNLQNFWYQKLKETGFQDIEDTQSEQRFLKQWHSRYFFIRNTPEEYQENMDYFDMSLHFYWNYADFQNQREKQIWWLHCQGMSRREIAADFISKGIKISDSLVQIIVARLKKIMHSQLWSSNDRNNSQEELDND